MRVLFAARIGSVFATAIGLTSVLSGNSASSQEAKPNPVGDASKPAAAPSSPAPAPAPAATPAPAPTPIVTKYRFEGAYTMSIEADDLAEADRKASGSLRIDYENAVRAGKVEVTVDALEFSERNGDKTDTTRLSREGIEVQAAGQSPQLTKRADLDSIRKRMLDGFGAKLATIMTSPEGEELHREPHLRSGPLVTRNILESVRAFHVNFPKNANTWNAVLVLPIGPGRMAEGALRLEKQPANAEQVKVKVTGVLNAQSRGGSLEIARGEYQVSGEQTFDLKRNEWSHGSWRVEINLNALSQGRPVAVTGVMELSLKQR